MIEVRTVGKLGYCSGVSQAIKKAIESGDKHGHIYSLGTVAHNEEVVALLKEHGVHPIMDSEWWLSIKKPRGERYVVITAHGADPDTHYRLGKMGCVLINCTCPIVRKAQEAVMKLAESKFDIVIFGDPEHQEVKGLVGWAKDGVGWSKGNCKFVGDQRALFTPGEQHKKLKLGKKVGIVSQTTKSPADYADFIDTVVRHHLEGFQELRVLNTICPIVAERIAETRKLAGEVDMMFVVGSKESANTRNLEKACLSAIQPYNIKLIQNETQVEGALDEFLFRENNLPAFVGITAGTSTPIEVVERVIEVIQETWTKHKFQS